MQIQGVQNRLEALQVKEIREDMGLQELKLKEAKRQELRHQEVSNAAKLREIQGKENIHNKEEIPKEVVVKEIHEETEEVKLNSYSLNC